jgi:hypothetical protein
MLPKLDKFAPYAILLLLGYLTYASTGAPGLRQAEGKDDVKITKHLLAPKLLHAVAHASPADRDPFEVDWASYRHVDPASRPAATTASAPASRPAVEPRAEVVPEVPGPLVGVFIGDDVRLAVIGEKLYKPGAVVGGTNPDECWVVEDVQEDQVTLRFGKILRTLELPRQADNPNAKPGVKTPAHKPDVK